MIKQSDLDRLCEAGIISAEQHQRIMDFQKTELAGEESDKPSLPFFRTLYYLGGFTLIFAIVYYVSESWEKLGDAGRIAWTAGGMLFLGGAGAALKRTTYFIAGAILLLAAIACVPVLIFVIERAAGLLPQNALFSPYSGQNRIPVDTLNVAWLLIDGVTAIVSLATFRKFREPLLILPVLFFAWMTGLDFYNLATAQIGPEGLRLKAWLTVATGLAAIYLGVRDNRRAGAVAGWAWLFGLLLIFGALISLRFDHRNEPVSLIHQFNILIYGLTALLAASTLRSRIFLAFDGFGIFWFIQDMSWTYFSHSLGFTLVLAISGLATIAFGILLQRLYAHRFALKTDHT
jgi:hypothetical protein